MAAASVSIFLTGCAIEPTPDQTTGLYTTAIANHVRCEARQAIVRQTIDLLVAFGRSDWAERLRTGDADSFLDAEHHVKQLAPDLQKRLALYTGIAIAYQFTMDITEENNNRIDLNLLGPFSGGSGMLGVGGGLDRTRQNIRIFTITDTFQGLVNDRNICIKPATHIDYIYPMGGQIGVSEAVNNFVDLNELSRKSGRDVLKADKNGNTEVYAATFRFRTVIDAAFNPGINYNPTVFGPKSGTLTNTGKRTDDHQVIVAFSLPKPEGKTSLTGLGGTFYGHDSTSTDAGATGANARQAIRDAKVDYFLQNFRSGLIP